MTRSALLFFVFTLLFPFTVVSAHDAPLIHKEQLLSLLSSPDLILLDARSTPDWRTSNQKIPGAIRAAAKDYEQWSTKLDKDRLIVLYCA